jgi:hypothetical protein
MVDLVKSDLSNIQPSQPRQSGHNYGSSTNDLDRVLSALQSIPPDLPHDEWVRVGMAAHAGGLSFEDFDQWSAPAESYNARVCKAKWFSFKAGKGVGAGTLFFIAREKGWTEGNSTPRPAPVTAAYPKKPQPKPAQRMRAIEVWNRCELATDAHGYIKVKLGLPDGLRVVSEGDPLKIKGESMVGALVVPVFRPDGSISTLQCITVGEVAKRLKAEFGTNKVNLPLPVEGWFTLGKVTPDKPMTYVVEGIGQAWAIRRSTQACVVVTFGSGRMGKVASGLRESDDSARLVLVPDVGKEADAQKIAAELGCAVTVMPEGEANNFDVNDLFQRDGFDVVAALLESAIEPPRPEPKVHPLAKFVDVGGTPKPPCWVIPGFVGHGVVVISGAHGVGKTTALLPLAMTAAGLHGDELMPRQWRHVVYITEDVEQVRRILAGIVGHSDLNISMDLVRERIHIVEAVRLDPVFVASVGTAYREQFTRTVEGVEVLPLVVLDTKSAVLALANENDNAEASRMMAALKQGFDSLPVWLIGHVAKNILTRKELEGLTSRGASAIEGDANQTMFLICEGETRFLVLGKVRFEPRWKELEITSHTAATIGADEFGNIETVVMRWGTAAPPEISRKEAAEQAAKEQHKEDEVSLRQGIRDAVEEAWVTGNPLNRAGVKAKIPRNSSVVGAMLENLLNERWLYEVEVPTKERTNNKRSTFLVRLTTEEHEAVLSGSGLPDAKLEIPASWRKPAIPFVPAPESEVAEVNHAEV